MSQFLTFSLRDPKAAADMAKVALALNPTCSAELWNALGDALALDKMGEYRERLLQKQQEVLARLTQRHQQEYLLLINLVSKYAKEDGNPNHRDPEAQRSQHREDRT